MTFLDIIYQRDLVSEISKRNSLLSIIYQNDPAFQIFSVQTIKLFNLIFRLVLYELIELRIEPIRSLVHVGTFERKPKIRSVKFILVLHRIPIIIPGVNFINFYARIFCTKF